MEQYIVKSDRKGEGHVSTVEHETASGDRVKIQTQASKGEYKVVICERDGIKKKVSAYSAFELCAVCGHQCGFKVRDL